MSKFQAPYPDQRFDTFNQWIVHARKLTRHERHNNTEHGKDGWRGDHFTAMCVDSAGRHCVNGGDFKRADDENSFPVWWIWPDQIVATLCTHLATTPDAPDFKDLFEKCQEARDTVGFLGSVPECIAYLDGEGSAHMVEAAKYRKALEDIIARSKIDPLGTSKVIDMRLIAETALVEK